MAAGSFYMVLRIFVAVRFLTSAVFPVRMMVPPLPIPLSLVTAQPAELAVLAALFREIRSIGALFPLVPVVVVAVRRVVDSDSHAGLTHA